MRKLATGDLLAALAICVAYIVAIVKTTAGLGYARDEGFYFQAASSYGRWFETLFKSRAAAMDPRVVDGAWGVNHEHPGLIKSLFALSNLFLEKRHHFFAMEGTSYRFPAICLAGIAVALVYLWGTEARGRVAGAAAAVALAAMPRFFFQSHLACFDVPIVTMWTLTAYAYWRSLRSGGWLWPMLTGLAFGLALDTKHNSWFLPIACVGHAVAVQVIAAAFRRPGSEAWLRGKRTFAALGSMALVGPCVLYAFWPWIWHSTLPRLVEYAKFHLNHEYYNMEFLGVNYWKPPMPRGYAWLMTAATVPTVTLALVAAGVVTRASFWIRRGAAHSGVSDEIGSRRGSSVDLASTDLFWCICIVINYAAWLSPGTPIFGGTKHWMTAYPFFALFAGIGFDAVVRAARRELAQHRGYRFARALVGRPWLVGSILGSTVFAAPIVETIRSHPFGLSSYTPLVGGAAGAATLGLNRTFWGYTTGSVAPWLNKEAPRGASVYVHDTAGPSWDMLQRDGTLRRDLRSAWTIGGADFGLYHHEKHMLGQEYQNWIAFGTGKPAFIAGIDGVPVIWVYERPRR